MFKNPKRSKPTPKNTRAVGIARDTIEFLAPVAQRTLQNAITADGRNCLLYIPKIGGVRCTCSNEDPLDVDGKMHPDVMNNLLASTGLSVGEYPTPNSKDPNKAHIGDSLTKKATNGFVVTDASPKFKTGGYAAKTFSLSNLDDDNFSADDFDIDLDSGFRAKGKIPSLVNGYVPTTNVSTTACPICLGIGWVGGFDLYGGTRLVLSAVSANSFNGCRLVNSAPDYVEMSKGTSIDYNSITLPAGVERIDEISLWSHREKVPFKLFIDNEEVAVEAVGRYFDGHKHSIKFSPTINASITHATFQYGVSDILIDVSKKTITNNNSLYDQQTEVTLVLPPITQKELKGAIVYDSTDAKFYRVTSMNTSQTQGGWAQMLDLEARVVQPYELTHLLPKMNIHKIKKFGGSFNNASMRPRYF